MPTAKKPDNMELWNAVCTTPPEHTKRVNQRGGFTSICQQYQLRVATDLWGPYGSTWGMRDLAWGEIRNAAGELVEVTLDAEFAYPGGAFPISSDAPYRTGNDTRKKLLTDATTKALSKLGFSADVFLGLYDDNKYVQSLRQQVAPPSDAPAPPSDSPDPVQHTEFSEADEVEAVKAALCKQFGGEACKLAIAQIWPGEAGKRLTTLDECTLLRERLEQGQSA